MWSTSCIIGPNAAWSKVIGSLTIQWLSISLLFTDPEQVNLAFRLQTPLIQGVPSPFDICPHSKGIFLIVVRTSLLYLHFRQAHSTLPLK